jgi:hypothetical protein
MSCKNKLSNLPGLSNINEQFKKLTPSSLEGLSPKLKAKKIAEGFGDMAGDLTRQVGNQIGNFANDATGKLSNLGGLVSGLGTDLKAGIPEDLKGIKTSIANGIISAKNEISKQYQNMKSAFDCEDETTAEALQSTQETTAIKSSVMSTSVSSTKNLTNSEIKKVSENTEYKDKKTQEITSDTISKGTTKASDSQSNKQIVNTQTTSLSALQTVSAPQDEKFEKDTDNLYNESTLLLKDIQAGLVFLFTNAKPYIDDDKITAGNIIKRTYSTLVENVNGLDKLYTQNELDLDNTKFNLDVNNKQCMIVKFAVQKTNGTMSSETYIQNINKTLRERLTLIQEGEAKTPPKKLVIKTIKGSLV